MKPIVTDTYDFPTLIRRGYVYVDKTALLHRLVSGVDGLMFFMSRPRRFGKSLMISTLEQIFKGEKALFKGLAISKTGYDWAKYPIIRLDMTAFDHTSGLAAFKQALAHELGGTEPIAAFRELIAKKAKASRGKGVVVLIDEYDSPVSGLLGRPKELEAMREFLQAFYRVLKLEVASLRFLMMTGVSKFTKLSVFSGLNNLTDVTMRPEYAALLGYTPEELTAFFGPQIDAFAQETGRTPQDVVAELLAWYDSYRFSPKSELRVCNPVSVGRALQEKSCEPYWDRTGSATLVIERLRKLGKLPLDVESFEVLPKRLDVCDLKKLPFDALMYQGGYLTIKEVKPSGSLVLGIPNREVSEAVYGGFLDEVMSQRSDDFISQAYDLRRLLETDAEALPRVLTAIFAMVPHEWKIKNEAEAKRYFLLFMKMAGADIAPECESAKGRADAVLKTAQSICIFEFKYGKTARQALRQIVAKGYAKPYAADNRPCAAYGVNYDPKNGEVVIAVDHMVSPKNRNSVPNKVPNKTTSVRVLELLRANPRATAEALGGELGIGDRAVRKIIAQHKAAGRLVRIGSRKSGHWQVVNEV